MKRILKSYLIVISIQFLVLCLTRQVFCFTEFYVGMWVGITGVTMVDILKIHK